VAYLLGVPWRDCRAIGGLLGTRALLNELIAFAPLKEVQNILIHRSVVIASFALFGFAHIGSIRIQLGGHGALLPERPHHPAPPARGRARGGGGWGWGPFGGGLWPTPFPRRSGGSSCESTRTTASAAGRSPLEGRPSRRGSPGRLDRRSVVRRGPWLGIERAG